MILGDLGKTKTRRASMWESGRPPPPGLAIRHTTRHSTNPSGRQLMNHIATLGLTALTTIASCALFQSLDKTALRARSLVIEDKDGVEQIRLESMFGGGRILMGPVEDGDGKAWAIEIRSDLVGRPAIIMRDISWKVNSARIVIAMEGNPAKPTILVRDSQGVHRVSVGGYPEPKSCSILRIRDDSDKIVWEQ